MRALSAALVAVLFSASVAFAAPTTPQIEAKKAEAATAQATLDKMRDDFDAQVEEYDRVNEALQQTRAQIDQTRTRLEAEDAELQRVQQLLDDRAAGIYRGDTNDVFAVVLGTRSFEDFLTRLDLLRRIADSDAQLVNDVRDARAQVVDTQRALERRETEQVALRTQVDAKRRDIQAATDRQTRFLASLNGQIAQLIKAEEQRLAAEAAARAAALKAAQEAAARAAAANGPQTVAAGGRAADAAPGQGHPEVVGVAMKYLGVPYAWGGTSPSGFDCSGLAQYCYAQIGISIPRTSQEQYYAGKHIPADRLDLLRKGDLLFFGHGKSPDAVHHVVIYAGGDDIIEAPYTGADVRVSSLAARLSHNEYVGASRF